MPHERDYTANLRFSGWLIFSLCLGLGCAVSRPRDKLGIECIVQFRGPKEGETVRHGGGEPIGGVDFIRKHFKNAVK